MLPSSPATTLSERPPSSAVVGAGASRPIATLDEGGSPFARQFEQQWRGSVARSESSQVTERQIAADRLAQDRRAQDRLAQDRLEQRRSDQTASEQRAVVDRLEHARLIERRREAMASEDRIAADQIAQDRLAQQRSEAVANADRAEADRLAAAERAEIAEAEQSAAERAEIAEAEQSAAERAEMAEAEQSPVERAEMAEQSAQAATNRYEQRAVESASAESPSATIEIPSTEAVTAVASTGAETVAVADEAESTDSAAAASIPLATAVAAPPPEAAAAGGAVVPPSEGEPPIASASGTLIDTDTVTNRAATVAAGVTTATPAIDSEARAALPDSAVATHQSGALADAGRAPLAAGDERAAAPLPAGVSERSGEPLQQQIQQLLGRGGAGSGSDPLESGIGRQSFAAVLKEGSGDVTTAAVDPLSSARGISSEGRGGEVDRMLARALSGEEALRRAGGSAVAGEAAPPAAAAGSAASGDALLRSLQEAMRGGGGAHAVSATAPAAAPAAAPANATVATAPPTLQLNHPLQQPGWDRVMSERVVWMAKQDLREAQLQLNPRNMGPIEVRVSLQQDQASVQFVAPQAATRDALEAALPKLREMLAEQGLNLAQSEVSQQSFQQRSGGGSGRGAPGDAAGRAAVGGLNSTDLADQSPLITPLHGGSLARGVDFYA